MAMFGRHHGGHPFSDLLRGNATRVKTEGAGSAGTSSVGKPKGAQPHSSKNPGGVAVTVPGTRSISKSSAHMDGKSHPVPRGGGGMQHSRGIDNPKRTPHTLDEHQRLGNFGEPSGHATKGTDGPMGGKERKGMPGSTPANMDGKAHKVKKSAKGHRAPAFHIGNAHINHGSPKVGAHPRHIGGSRSRDLAAHL
jgi:hypothetical protein